MNEKKKFNIKKYTKNLQMLIMRLHSRNRNMTQCIFNKNGKFRVYYYKLFWDNNVNLDNNAKY